jgi:hypothetical protein
MKINIDDQFGHWKVIEYAGKSRWKCLCTGCNKVERVIIKWNLISKSKSCGCQRVENMKQTNLIKYDTEWVQNIPEVRQKTIDTCLEKYGVDNYAKTEEKKRKTKETNLKKYGVEHHKKKKKILFGSRTYGSKI